MASERRLSTTMPQPSPRTEPLALASKVLHRPSSASTCNFDIRIVESGRIMRFTPPAKVMRHSPARRLRQARCTATREDEQAVSLDRLPPCSRQTDDKRTE